MPLGSIAGSSTSSVLLRAFGISDVGDKWVSTTTAQSPQRGVPAVLQPERRTLNIALPAIGGRMRSLRSGAPPEKADGELWELLTDEERRQFSGPDIQQPLAYNRVRLQPRPRPPMILGSRLDLRA